MGLMQRLRTLAQRLRAAKGAAVLWALWGLWKDPRTPPLARWLAVAVLAYALSPIDLIPDFIPVLGLLDDLILVPLGVALVLRCVPAALWQEHLARASAQAARLPKWWVGAMVVVVLWLAALALLAWWLWPRA